MDPEPVISSYSLLPKQIKEELLRLLKVFPQNFEKWLYGAIDHNNILQGDIFLNIPFPIFMDHKPDSEIKKEIPLLKSDVMILSNSCDVSVSKASFITIAPIAPIDEISDRKSKSSKVESIMKNEVTHMLYIPETPSHSIADSVVFLNKAMSIPRNYINEKANLKVASLSQVGHYFMLTKLAWHFIRLSDDMAIRTLPPAES